MKSIQLSKAEMYRKIQRISMNKDRQVKKIVEAIITMQE
jgi:AmiR/NasT family two-component response regulator